MILPLLLPYASASCVAALAFVTLLRSRRNIADRMFASGMMVLAIENVFTGLAAQWNNTDQGIYWQQWATLTLSLVPGFWVLFSLSYARGNAADFQGKWRLPLIGAFVLPLLVAVVFYRDLLIIETGLGPGSPLIIRFGWAGLVLNFAVLVASVFVLMNLERTFRASVGTMRWRIKFVLMGTGLLFIGRLYTSSQALLFHGIEPSLQFVNSATALVATLLMFRSLFRIGGFTLDVYPSQFVLQGSVTVLLAGIYLLFVGGLSKVVSSFGGDATFALNSFILLLSLVLLTLLLQSDRVRLYVRRAISRNFQRPLYDYRTMWQKFNKGMASRVEQGDLCRALARLVAEMFEALSVSIWLIDDKRAFLNLAASTSVSEEQSRAIGPDPKDSDAVIRHFQMHQEPADIEGSRSPWAAALRQWHPGEFANGGHRLCIPLIAHGEMIGLITLGDRVAGATYSLQDFDMLKCVGDHAATCLLNVRLSQKLLQAKEMEAFQTMAAFFVHDLKNAASTLNLMVKNLPIHFNDPAFRADTLRGISKTVAHMNHLVGRLSMLRHELKIEPALVDFNALVDEAIAVFEKETAGALKRDFSSLPKISLDQEQIHKVVTNLVLNAKEASPDSAAVQVTTRFDNPWIVLTVTDEGCGMSPEFLRNSLFRPFQTTKKSGLGIGMFQSKMIVEAHHGRITVASEPGEGTTFQVFLPTAAP